MRLIYRGVVFDKFDYQLRSGNTGKPTPPTQTKPYTVSYRGTSWTVDPSAPKPKPPVFLDRYDLIYRGITLHVRHNSYAIDKTRKLKWARV
jgi:hypothetical protein